MEAILLILGNAVAILIAAKLVPGIVFTGTWTDLLIGGVILGIVNALIRPVLKLISLPVIILTFGAFSVLLNIVLFILASRFIPHFSVHGFWAGFWGVIIVSLVNHLIFIHNNE